MGNQGFRLEYGDRVTQPPEAMEGKGLLSIGTTAVELTFTRTPIRGIVVTAHEDNSGIIYLGKSDVSSDGSNAVFMIPSSQFLGISYNDVDNAMYVVASVADQQVVVGAVY